MMNAQAPVRNSADAAKRFYPHRFRLWTERGLSPRAASALALASIDTVEQVAALGRAYFAGKPNVGAKTLEELAILAGWPPKNKTPVDAIAAALGLSIADPDEAREAATDAVIALRRSGFVIASHRSAPGGSRGGRIAPSTSLPGL